MRRVEPDHRSPIQKLTQQMDATKRQRVEKEKNKEEQERRNDQQLSDMASAILQESLHKLEIIEAITLIQELGKQTHRKPVAGFFYANKKKLFIPKIIPFDLDTFPPHQLVEMMRMFATPSMRHSPIPLQVMGLMIGIKSRVGELYVERGVQKYFACFANLGDTICIGETEGYADSTQYPYFDMNGDVDNRPASVQLPYTLLHPGGIRGFLKGKKKRGEILTMTRHKFISAVDQSLPFVLKNKIRN